MSDFGRLELNSPRQRPTEKTAEGPRCGTDLSAPQEPHPSADTGRPRADPQFKGILDRLYETVSETYALRMSLVHYRGEAASTDDGSPFFLGGEGRR